MPCGTRTALEMCSTSSSSLSQQPLCANRLAIKPRVPSKSPRRDARLSARFDSYSQFSPSIASWSVVSNDSKNCSRLGTTLDIIKLHRVSPGGNLIDCGIHIQRHNPRRGLGTVGPGHLMYVCVRELDVTRTYVYESMCTSNLDVYTQILMYIHES